MWGTEGRLRELLGDDVASVEISRRSFVFGYRCIEHYADMLRSALGLTRQTFEKLGEAGKKELAGELADLARRFNRSGGGTVVVPSDYPKGVALRR